MELFRLHAYSVSPSRTKDVIVRPKGGAVSLTADLRALIEKNFVAAKFSERTTVVFNVDEGTRTCAMRDEILRFAFGEPAAARIAALTLSANLALAMDGRSSTGLFVPAAYRDGENRQVVLWVFPKEDALRITNTAKGASIELVTDAFSQRSRLRKAAQFVGGDGRTAFLEGRVLDYQAAGGQGDVASFWVERFLTCSPAVKDDAGSRMIARALREVHKVVTEVVDSQHIHAAALAVRSTPHRRMSFASFANRYFEGALKERFIAAGPSAQAQDAQFEFRREVFDDLLHFRVFQLESGVYVSSPLSEVGADVKLYGPEGRQLVCEGTVVAEKLQSRHG